MARRTKLTDQAKAWAKPRPLRRPYGTQPERRRLLIVCEGEKTEPNYFQSIRKLLPPQVAEVIDIQGLGANTRSLVNKAKAIRDKRAGTDYAYDETWVVFDRDSFAPDDFDNAIESARAAGMAVAWSNEAFELWYLLHFEDRRTPIARDACIPRLSKLLGEGYRKNDQAMYDKLTRLGSEAQAMARAAGLRDYFKGTPPHEANPCTTVDELVTRLNEFKIK